MTAPALLIAAPVTGSGKTVVALAVLAALARRGRRVAAFKVGPDRVDAAAHERVTGRPSFNLDSWSMRLGTLVGLLEAAGAEADLLIGEGMAGLADGAPDGTGSTGDLAALLGIPVVLVVDCARLGGSVAPLVEGFLRWRDEVEVVGLVLDRVAGAEHAKLLIEACEAHFSTRVLGWLPDDPALAFAARQLGPAPPIGQPAPDRLLDRAAERAAELLDLERLQRLARPPSLSTLGHDVRPWPPLGQRIAIARDPAFGLAYPAVLEGWRAAGAELVAFSPLAGEAPDPTADAVYLPGGHPERHGAALASARGWREGLAAAAGRGAFVYGEGGGYAALGERIVDAAGATHAMAGLLPVATRPAEPAPWTGWRRIALAAACPLGPRGAAYRGHDPRTAVPLAETGPPFARACDATGRELGPTGCRVGSVCGSPVHLIDRETA